MTQCMKLALPIGLGLITAALNWATVSAKITPHPFVKVSTDMDRGDRFSADNLAKVELSGELGNLAATAIAWDDRAILYGRPVPRTLEEGDIVFQRDFVPQRLEPQPGELAVQVAIRNTPVVPNLIFAGDELGFLMGKDLEGTTQVDASTPGEAGYDNGLPGNPDAAELDYLGPFRVLAVGSDIVATGETSQRRAGVSQILTVAMHCKPGSKELDETSTQLILAAEGRGTERIVAIVFHQDNESHGSTP